MSRIGRKPVVIPAGVEVAIDGQNITVKGPKGTLNSTIHHLITATVEGNQVIVTRANEEGLARSVHGLSRTLINNMVVGVSTGFSKTLELVGTGYRAECKDGKNLVIKIGFSHDVIRVAPENVTFETPNQNTIVVKGIDKQVVGALAADIRSIRKPEPYHGKGIKYIDEHVRRKEGKTGKK